MTAFIVHCWPVIAKVAKALRPRASHGFIPRPRIARKIGAAKAAKVGGGVAASTATKTAVITKWACVATPISALGIGGYAAAPGPSGGAVGSAVVPFAPGFTDSGIGGGGLGTFGGGIDLSGVVPIPDTILVDTPIAIPDTLVPVTIPATTSDTPLVPVTTPTPDVPLVPISVPEIPLVPSILIPDVVVPTVATPGIVTPTGPDVTLVPEPASLTLLTMAVVLLFVAHWLVRRQKRAPARGAQL
jgi:hypothetical protein